MTVSFSFDLGIIQIIKDLQLEVSVYADEIGGMDPLCNRAARGIHRNASRSPKKAEASSGKLEQQMVRHDSDVDRNLVEKYANSKNKLETIEIEKRPADLKLSAGFVFVVLPFSRICFIRNP